MTRPLFSIVIFLAGLLILAGPANACPIFKRAEPKVGSEIQASPPEVRLHFSGTVLEKEGQLDVFDMENRLVSEGKPYKGENDSVIAVKLKPLPPGHYKVVWAIHCECEGNTSSVIPGNFKFTVMNQDLLRKP